MTRSLHWPAAEPAAERPRFMPLRLLAAALLQGASRALARSATQLVALPRRPLPTLAPMFEFHAEAGAPEGALYLDGELVARLPGVTRL
jgi:hypothetical protein